MNKFNFQHFLIKITSTAFWAWLMSNAEVILFCLLGITGQWMTVLIVGNIIITCLFIGGKILIDALAKMIEK